MSHSYLSALYFSSVSFYMIKLSLFVLFVFSSTTWHIGTVFTCFVVVIFLLLIFGLFTFLQNVFKKSSKYLIQKIIAKVVVKASISFSLILWYVCWLALFCGLKKKKECLTLNFFLLRICGLSPKQKFPIPCLNVVSSLKLIYLQ